MLPYWRRFQTGKAVTAIPPGRFAIPVSLRLVAKTGIVTTLDAPIGLAFEIDHTRSLP
jgi:hypothetical protein